MFKAMKAKAFKPDWYTPLSEIPAIVESARKVAASKKTHSLAWRRQQLEAILQLVDENKPALKEALKKDMGQGDHFVELFEISAVCNQVQFALDNINQWVAAQRVPTPFPTNLSPPVHSELKSYPRGLVLIMTPWNFPIALVLNPLINAIAAGNCCVIKPSELSAHTSRLLATLITKYLDPEAIKIVHGAAEEATELLKIRYDAISYTGGLRVGKVVAAAAAKTLTPVLLELGGKTPAFVCEDAHVESAAMRIAWGKWAGNAGQFCITTDYVLVVESLKDKFVECVKKNLVEFYGEDPSKSEDYGRMISVDHAKRVVSLVDSTCQILHGKGLHKPEERYVEPMIVEGNASSTIMKEEIFGPILAIVPVKSTEAAIDFVNKNFGASNNHPLCLYIFSKSTKRQRLVMDNVLSGMCCVNHVVLNGGNFHLPFGGVGYSGMGGYYGKHGFDFFSHTRGALITNNNTASPYDPANWLTCPPFTSNKIAVVQFVTKIPQALKIVTAVIKVVIPVLVAMAVYQYPDQVREFNLNTIIGWAQRTFAS